MEFGGIVPAPGGELFSGPPETRQFFGDDALGAGGLSFLREVELGASLLVPGSSRAFVEESG
jgi:hypothetical protein